MDREEYYKLQDYVWEQHQKQKEDKRALRRRQDAQFRNHQHLTTRLGILWKEYHDLFHELRELDDDGSTERAHIKQDEIYRKFILDTVSGRFETDKEYRAMALLMKINVVAYDTPNHWWYA